MAGRTKIDLRDFGYNLLHTKSMIAINISFTRDHNTAFRLFMMSANELAARRLDIALPEFWS